MKKYLLHFLFVLGVFKAYTQKTNEYPIPEKDSTTDAYFGTTIKDPYQWMEDSDDVRLAEWLKSQNKITNIESKKQYKKLSLRSQIATLYNNVEQKILHGYVYKDFKQMSKYEFEYKFTRMDRFPDLKYRLRGNERYKSLVKSKDFRIDKNDNVAITNRYVNEKYDLVAIEMTHNGTDWREIYFFDLKTGEQLADTLKNLRITSQLIWDERNVYYDSYDEPENEGLLLEKAKGQKFYYHVLGNSQSQDKLLYQNPDTTGTNPFHYQKLGAKLFFYHFFKNKEKTVRVISVASDDVETFYLKNFLTYSNSDTINLSLEELFGDTVIIRTNWNAPKGRVLRADINKLNEPFEIIPEYDIVLESVNRLGKDKLACTYRNEGAYLVLIFNLAGDLLKQFDFPEGKKVKYFRENKEDVAYTEFCVSSFIHPDIWYQLSLNDLTIKPVESIAVPYDPNSLETRYVKYTSKDGTKIPMYITCLKETKLTGKNPTLLYGYGGYGVTIDPEFDETKALWLLHGGILAIPNIRGGGSEGDNWAKAGRRLNKQNSIDDFISAAEYLIQENYTNSEKLGISGGSHGGLLVGAAITQRPDLFKAAVAEAGAFDMLRLEKYTAGSVNINLNEFGTVEDSLDFMNLKSYSPLHTIKKGVRYPNVLLICGDHDDRVPPHHSYKFLATLQENGNPESLYHLYQITGAGHGGAITSKDWIDKILFEYYFLFKQLGLKIY